MRKRAGRTSDTRALALGRKRVRGALLSALSGSLRRASQMLAHR
jgi:hypothetical protein